MPSFRRDGSAEDVFHSGRVSSGEERGERGREDRADRGLRGELRPVEGRGRTMVVE